MTSVKMTGRGPALNPRRRSPGIGREQWPELLASVWGLEQILAELPAASPGQAGTVRDRICALHAELIDDLGAQGWIAPSGHGRRAGDHENRTLRTVELIVGLLNEAYDLINDLTWVAGPAEDGTRSDLQARAATCRSAIEEALLYGAEELLDRLSPERRGEVSASVRAGRSLRIYLAALDELEWWERHGSSPLTLCNAVLQLRLQLADHLAALGWLPSTPLLDQLGHDRQAASLRALLDE